jgi:hypothetical protein
VCVGVGVCVCVRAYVFVCVCVCVCARETEHVKATLCLYSILPVVTAVDAK